MIEVKNLTKNFNKDFSALLNLSFKTDVRPTIIVGEEGAGKTTLLNIFAGLDKDYCGEVLVNGEERKALCLKDAKISYVTEIPTLFESKSVYYNLEYVYRLRGKSFNKEEAMKEIKKIAEDFELFGILDKKIKKCNLFEKRLVCVARACLKKSTILMVDEPFKNLIYFEIASLWQAILSAQGKLSSDLVITDNGQNLAYFEGCNIIKIEYGVKKTDFCVKS